MLTTVHDGTTAKYNKTASTATARGQTDRTRTAVHLTNYMYYILVFNGYICYLMMFH